MKKLVYVAATLLLPMSGCQSPKNRDHSAEIKQSPLATNGRVADVFDIDLAPELEGSSCLVLVQTYEKTYALLMQDVCPRIIEKGHEIALNTLSIGGVPEEISKKVVEFTSTHYTVDKVFEWALDGKPTLAPKYPFTLRCNMPEDAVPRLVFFAGFDADDQSDGIRYLLYDHLQMQAIKIENCDGASSPSAFYNPFYAKVDCGEAGKLDLNWTGELTQFRGTMSFPGKGVAGYEQTDLTVDCSMQYGLIP